MSQEPIRWGIVGTGAIAHKLADALAILPDAVITGVSSRSRDTAERFGARYNVRHRHVGVEELAANPEVDVVYIATPHSNHCAETLACLDGGKHVLCEKPFALNAAQGREMIDRARQRGLFLMEALWTLFFPAMQAVRELLAEGAIGEVRLVQSSFGFQASGDEAGRHLDPALGGGSLLDVGIYNLLLAHMVYGSVPDAIQSVPQMSRTGVDEVAGLVLGYPGRGMAVSTSAVMLETHHDAWIYGTTGRIEIPEHFWRPQRFILQKGGNWNERRYDCLGNGYTYEAIEVMNCVREGRTESALATHQRTLDLLETMDAIRKPWGLMYPGERA